jgi:AcrR family transcriptional regulator
MAESTRQRLINTAQAMFYTHGFHAVGLDRILADVGVTKTTFYNHFESKDDLIVAVLKEHDAQETSRFLEAIEERAAGDPRGQILAMFDLLEEWFAESDFRGCMFINAAAAFPALNDPIHIVASEHNAHISECIRQLAEQAGAEDPAELADKIMVVLTGSIVTRHASLNPGAASIARRTVEMLLEHYLPPVPV